jgi:hypothetical protein
MHRFNVYFPYYYYSLINLLTEPHKDIIAPQFSASSISSPFYEPVTYSSQPSSLMMENRVRETQRDLNTSQTPSSTSSGVSVLVNDERYWYPPKRGLYPSVFASPFPSFYLFFISYFFFF